MRGAKESRSGLLEIGVSLFLYDVVYFYPKRSKYGAEPKDM